MGAIPFRALVVVTVVVGVGLLVAHHLLGHWPDVYTWLPEVIAGMAAGRGGVEAHRRRVTRATRKLPENYPLL